LIEDLKQTRSDEKLLITKTTSNLSLNPTQNIEKHQTNGKVKTNQTVQIDQTMRKQQKKMHQINQ
jgi:hypothetical protein